MSLAKLWALASHTTLVKNLLPDLAVLPCMNRQNPCEAPCIRFSRFKKLLKHPHGCFYFRFLPFLAGILEDELEAQN